MKVKVQLKRDEFEELMYDFIDQNRENLNIKDGDELGVKFLCKELYNRYYDDIVKDLQFSIEDLIDDKTSELRISIADNIVEKAENILYEENI